MNVSLSQTEIRRVDGGIAERMKKLETQKFNNLKDYLVNEAIVKGEIGKEELKMLYSKGFKSSSIRFMPHSSLQHIKSVDELSLDQSRTDFKPTTFSPAATQTESLDLLNKKKQFKGFDFNPNYVIKRNFNTHKKPAAIFDEKGNLSKLEIKY